MLFSGEWDEIIELDLHENCRLHCNSGLGFMAVVDFATSDFETCPKNQNWANFINKSTTES